MILTKRLTYRDKDFNAHLTNYGEHMYCCTQSTTQCFAALEENIPDMLEKFKIELITAINNSRKFSFPNDEDIVDFIDNYYKQFYNTYIKDWFEDTT